MTAQLDARLYELYRAASEKAERERGWNVFVDVPWHLARRAPPPPALAGVGSCVETFFCMHAALPEFVARGLDATRDAPTARWFVTSWANEKARHQLAFREWLERTGRRTRQELATLERGVIANGCAVPFSGARQLFFYGAVQEMATFVTYAKHREVAKQAGDECLRTIYDFAARDEFAHARFFEAATKAFLDDDRRLALSAMADVLEGFVSPGEILLADYEERMLAVREAGLDRSVFIQRVYTPLLKRLGVTRRDLALARHLPPPLVEEVRP